MRAARELTARPAASPPDARSKTLPNAAATEAAAAVLRARQAAFRSYELGLPYSRFAKCLSSTFSVELKNCTTSSLHELQPQMLHVSRRATLAPIKSSNHNLTTSVIRANTLVRYLPDSHSQKLHAAARYTWRPGCSSRPSVCRTFVWTFTQIECGRRCNTVNKLALRFFTVPTFDKHNCDSHSSRKSGINRGAPCGSYVNVDGRSGTPAVSAWTHSGNITSNAKNLSRARHSPVSRNVVYASSANSHADTTVKLRRVNRTSAVDVFDPESGFCSPPTDAGALSDNPLDKAKDENHRKKSTNGASSHRVGTPAEHPNACISHSQESRSAVSSPVAVEVVSNAAAAFVPDPVAKSRPADGTNSAADRSTYAASAADAGALPQSMHSLAQAPVYVNDKFLVLANVALRNPYQKLLKRKTREAVDSRRNDTSAPGSSAAPWLRAPLLSRRLRVHGSVQSKQQQLHKRRQQKLSCQIIRRDRTTHFLNHRSLFYSRSKRRKKACASVSDVSAKKLKQNPQPNQTLQRMKRMIFMVESEGEPACSDNSAARVNDDETAAAAGVKRLVKEVFPDPNAQIATRLPFVRVKAQGLLSDSTGLTSQSGTKIGRRRQIALSVTRRPHLTPVKEVQLSQDQLQRLKGPSSPSTQTLHNEQLLLQQQQLLQRHDFVKDQRQPGLYKEDVHNVRITERPTEAAQSAALPTIAAEGAADESFSRRLLPTCDGVANVAKEDMKDGVTDEAVFTRERKAVQTSAKNVIGWNAVQMKQTTSGKTTAARQTSGEDITLEEKMFCPLVSPSAATLATHTSNWTRGRTSCDSEQTDSAAKTEDFTAARGESGILPPSLKASSPIVVSWSASSTLRRCGLTESTSIQQQPPVSPFAPLFAPAAAVVAAAPVADKDVVCTRPVTVTTAPAAASIVECCQTNSERTEVTLAAPEHVHYRTLGSSPAAPTSGGEAAYDMFSLPFSPFPFAFASAIERHKNAVAAACSRQQTATEDLRREKGTAYIMALSAGRSIPTAGNKSESCGNKVATVGSVGTAAAVCEKKQERLQIHKRQQQQQSAQKATVGELQLVTERQNEGYAKSPSSVPSFLRYGGTRLLDWSYRNGNVLITAGSVLALAGTMMADMRLLRGFNLLASLCYFSYNFTRRPRLFDAACWNIVFFSLNFFMLYRYLTEHKEVAFTNEELDVFERYFLPAGLSPRRFRTLLALGHWKTVPAHTVLTQQPQFDSVFGSQTANSVRHTISTVTEEEEKIINGSDGEAGEADDASIEREETIKVEIGPRKHMLNPHAEERRKYVTAAAGGQLLFILKGQVDVYQNGALIDHYHGGDRDAIVGLEAFLSYVSGLRRLAAMREQQQVRRYYDKQQEQQKHTVSANADASHRVIPDASAELASDASAAEFVNSTAEYGDTTEKPVKAASKTAHRDRNVCLYSGNDRKVEGKNEGSAEDSTLKNDTSSASRAECGADAAALPEHAHTLNKEKYLELKQEQDKQFSHISRDMSGGPKSQLLISERDVDSGRIHSLRIEDGSTSAGTPADASEGKENQPTHSIKAKLCTPEKLQDIAAAAQPIYTMVNEKVHLHVKHVDSCMYDATHYGVQLFPHLKSKQLAFPALQFKPETAAVVDSFDSRPFCTCERAELSKNVTYDCGDQRTLLRSEPDDSGKSIRNAAEDNVNINNSIAQASVDLQKGNVSKHNNQDSSCSSSTAATKECPSKCYELQMNVEVSATDSRRSEKSDSVTQYISTDQDPSHVAVEMENDGAKAKGGTEPTVKPQPAALSCSVDQKNETEGSDSEPKDSSLNVAETSTTSLVLAGDEGTTVEDMVEGEGIDQPRGTSVFGGATVLTQQQFAVCLTDCEVLAFDIDTAARFVLSDPVKIGFPVLQGLASVLVERSYAQAIRLAIHNYNSVLAGVLADGIVQPNERQFLRHWRERSGITDEQHQHALRRFGWTVEEFERGERIKHENADAFASRIGRVLKNAFSPLDYLFSKGGGDASTESVGQSSRSGNGAKINEREVIGNEQKAALLSQAACARNGKSGRFDVECSDAQQFVLFSPTVVNAHSRGHDLVNETALQYTTNRSTRKADNSTSKVNNVQGGIPLLDVATKPFALQAKKQVTADDDTATNKLLHLQNHLYGMQQWKPEEGDASEEQMIKKRARAAEAVAIAAQRSRQRGKEHLDRGVALQDDEDDEERTTSEPVEGEENFQKKSQ